MNNNNYKISPSKKSGGYAGYLATGLSEIQLQAACFQWAWIDAMQLKASGVVAGVHDMPFYWQRQLYLFEFKVGTNRQTPEQIAFGAAMMAQGAILYEVRDVQTFQTIFKSIVE